MAASVCKVHRGIMRYTCNGFIPQSGIIFVSAFTSKCWSNCLYQMEQSWYWPDTVKLYTVQAGIKPVPGQYRDVCWALGVFPSFHLFDFTRAKSSATTILKTKSLFEVIVN